MNWHKFVFTVSAIGLAAATYWTLATTPVRRPNVPAFSAAEYQRPLTRPPQPHRNINSVLSAGVNPFALPPDVSAAEVLVHAGVDDSPAGVHLGGAESEVLLEESLPLLLDRTSQSHRLGDHRRDDRAWRR